MKAEILTPDALIYEGEAEMITLPGELGSFQVLDNHAPIISTLVRGTITLKNKSGIHNFLATGGVVEVTTDKVSILAESIIT